MEPSTIYYYRAYVILNNSTYVFGDVQSFQTTAAQDNPGTDKGWLELPRSTTGSDYYTGTFMAGSARNYTYMYQYSTYTSLWTAYPLYSDTMGGGYSANWKKNPNIAESAQVNCWDASYNVNYGDTYWSSTQGSEFYARGHNIPNADRNGNSTMQTQTFYATNSTPQIQNKFNASIWNALEGDVRTVASSDTVYVVTGATFQKVGETKPVTRIHPKGDETKEVPVPNYYWKVLLKVEWSTSGNTKTVSSAKAIGVWIPHQQYNNNDYSSYITSVDQIEEWTGFDFFANLPGTQTSGIEQSAESNTSWSQFQSF